MAKRKPFTKRERSYRLNSRFGYRSTNEWGSGDLPAPYAEGDVLLLTPEAHAAMSDEQRSRLRGQGPGYFIVTYAPSIDEGDVWYVRVWNGEAHTGSDRMHMAFTERSVWDHPCNYMEGFELVETADPEGLAERERLIAEGWEFTDRWDVCPTCGNMTRKGDAA